MNSSVDVFSPEGEIEKKIFSQATLSKIDLVPASYAIWYAYFSNSHPDLNREVDAVVASGVHFNTTLHQELYNKYLRVETESLLVRDVQSETEELVKKVFSEMLGANKSAHKYGSRLENFSDQLSKAKGLGEMAQIIKEMIQDTKSMSDSTREMQEKLDQASKETQALRLKLQQTEEEAARDGLTGLNNRKAFDLEMEKLYEKYQAEGLGFSLLVLDIDFFKKFNDDYGHQVGDRVLAAVGTILIKGLKGNDFSARYGGEEFVVILLETSLEDATIVAEQLRIQISVKKPSAETKKPMRKLTASIGAAQVNSKDTIRSIFERADKALYLAKDSGRNNVKTEKDL
ncbi:MAG: GGDEF domain-containing protein [Thermodesulfobacteriota bacterium]